MAIIQSTVPCKLSIFACTNASTYKAHQLHAAHLLGHHAVHIKPPSEPLSELPEPSSQLCHFAMMIGAKNGATTIATAAMTVDQKAREPDNFVDTDQITSYAANQTKDKYSSYMCI